MDAAAGLYIDGEFVDPTADEWFESVGPYTNEPWIRVPRAGSDDVDDAIGAAHRAAFEGEWSNLTPTERGEWLFELAAELEE